METDQICAGMLTAFPWLQHHTSSNCLILKLQESKELLASSLKKKTSNLRHPSIRVHAQEKLDQKQDLEHWGCNSLLSGSLNEKMTIISSELDSGKNTYSLPSKFIKYTVSKNHEKLWFLGFADSLIHCSIEILVDTLQGQSQEENRIWNDQPQSMKHYFILFSGVRYALVSDSIFMYFPNMQKHLWWAALCSVTQVFECLM